MKYRTAIAAVVISLALVSGANAQQLIVYPSQGQSTDQQAQDQAECRTWAVQQTGYDPASPPAQPVTTAAAPQGGMLRGAARGAVLGVTVGAIAGDAGKGAAAGAAGGALIGGFRRIDQQRANEQQQSQAQAQYQQQVAAQNQTYNRALSACLQGRGYTVQ
ncbi:MAG: glycine zipper family protein [Kiloniellales bacterium]